MTPEERIKKRAAEIGFSLCGITPCTIPAEERSRFSDWLDAGCGAGMSYLSAHRDMRSDPSLLFEGAVSAVVCLSAYKPSKGRIASYATYYDYHYSLKKGMNTLLDYVRELFPGSEGAVFVDSAPVMERALARGAGLGWVGRNSMLINTELGSFTLISVILTTAKLAEEVSPVAEDMCGECRRCIENCPAGAIRDDRMVDARRCISYHTIESHTPIPQDILSVMERRLFGCDACLRACPHNARIISGVDAEESPLLVRIEGVEDITDEEWLAMGSSQFRRRFAHTPLWRCGLKRIKEITALRGVFSGGAESESEK